jgi:hypothetical protein
MKMPSPPAGERNRRRAMIIVPPVNSNEPCVVDPSYQHPTLWRVYEVGDPLVLKGEFDTREEAEVFVKNYGVAPP